MSRSPLFAPLIGLLNANVSRRELQLSGVPVAVPLLNTKGKSQLAADNFLSRSVTDMRSPRSDISSLV